MSPEPIRCIVCDRVIRDRFPRTVQMSTRTGRLYAAVNLPGGMLPPSEDQGWWDVGVTCYRKVAAAGAEGLAMVPR